MKVIKTLLIFTILASMAFTASAADLDVNRLEKVIKEQGNYTFGNSTHIDTLDWMVTQVAMASKDNSSRDRIEQAIIDTLASAQTDDAKDLLCRLLRSIGSAKSVPVLANMITDAKYSDMALFALGRINAPEAGAALQGALDKTNGKTKVGIINALVMVDYKNAVPQIRTLVKSSDKDVAIASAKALAHFASDDSVKALQGARNSAPADVQLEIDDAMLRSAEKFIEEGRKDQAVKIYSEFNSGDYSDQIKTAALAGLTKADPSNSLKMLSKTIKGNNSALQSNAVSMMGTIPGKKTTDILVDFLTSVSPAAQEMIINVLSMRGDSSETMVIIKHLSSDHENVRLTSLRALGNIGTTKAIEPVASFAAASKGRQKQMARESLVAMSGKGMHEAFVAEAISGDNAKRQEVIVAIGQRNSSIAFGTLNKIAKSESDKGVRSEAIMSMGRIGNNDSLKALVELIVKPKDSADRATLEKAAGILFTNIEDVNAQAGPVISGLRKAPNDAKPILLSLLSKPATPEALQAVQKELKASNSTVKGGAIRSLAKWPNIAATQDLYQVASTSRDQIHKILTLRGYVRLARYSDDSDSMYEKAMNIAKNPAEIKLVLAGLGNADSRRAFELAENQMGNNETKADAYLAAAKILSSYCWQDPKFAKPKLQHIADNAPNDSVKNQAKNTLNDMEKYKGYIFAWKTSELYREAGSDGGVIFSTAYEPETNPDSTDIKWSPLVASVRNGRVDMEKTFGRVDNCSSYLRTYIISPVEQDVRFELGADDMIKAWINGKTIDRTARLRQGTNTIMLKVGDSSGGWDFRCKIMKSDGSQIEGLDFKTTK